MGEAYSWNMNVYNKVLICDLYSSKPALGLFYLITVMMMHFSALSLRLYSLLIIWRRNRIPKDIMNRNVFHLEFDSFKTFYL